jgi:hypothetical protein
MAQAAMVTTARPPVMWPTQDLSPPIRYFEMPPWAMTTPANTKAGMASRGGERRAANMRWAIM